MATSEASERTAEEPVGRGDARRDGTEKGLLGKLKRPVDCDAAVNEITGNDGLNRLGCRTLLPLRRSSNYEQDDEQVYSGGPRASGADVCGCPRFCKVIF